MALGVLRGTTRNDEIIEIVYSCFRETWFTGDLSSPEPVLEGNTETETGSMEHMECVQTKSESEIKAVESRDIVESNSENLSENWIESTLSAGSERLFYLKFHLSFFFKLLPHVWICTGKRMIPVNDTAKI